MSLRTEPVLTQACYIIGCSEKLKNVSGTRWIWNVPLFINFFFFFFFLCNCTCSRSQISATGNWRGREEGQHTWASFSTKCGCSYSIPGAEDKGRGFSCPDAQWAWLRSQGQGDWSCQEGCRMSSLGVCGGPCSSNCHRFTSPFLLRQMTVPSTLWQLVAP